MFPVTHASFLETIAWGSPFKFFKCVTPIESNINIQNHIMWSWVNNVPLNPGKLFLLVPIACLLAKYFGL